MLGLITHARINVIQILSAIRVTSLEPPRQTAKFHEAPTTQMNPSLKELYELIEKFWYRRLTLFLILVLAVTSYVPLYSSLNLNLPLTALIGSIFFIIVLITLIWRLTTRVPQTPKNSVGFIVALSSEDKKAYEQIAIDFVDKIRELISQGDYIYPFYFIELPRYYSKQIKTPSDALEFLKRARGHFLIYGKVRVRRISGKPHHVLNLRTLVRHLPVPLEISKEFSKEIGSVIPTSNISIEMDNELEEFDITSEWVSVAARYVIGVAALISRDFTYARTLFESIWEEKQRLANDVAAIKIIKNRIGPRLVETYLGLIYLIEREWERSAKVLVSDKLEEYLNRLAEVAPDNYQVRTTRAFWTFVLKRDVHAAKAEIERCRNNRDTTWRFSDAFLSAYGGDLSNAEKQYKAIGERHAGMEVPFQVEGFIVWILEKEPEKAQLYYCLGLINWMIKGDKESAKKDFQTFLENTKATDYPEQHTRANSYIRAEPERKKRKRVT